MLQLYKDVHALKFHSDFQGTVPELFLTALLRTVLNVNSHRFVNTSRLNVELQIKLNQKIIQLLERMKVRIVCVFFSIIL